MSCTRCCSASSGWTPTGCSTSSAPQFFWVSLLIIFVECGLFFPFLPGDTLLFAIGLFIAAGQIEVIGPAASWSTWCSRWSCSSAGAFAGNVVRLRDRPPHRSTDLRARRPDPQAEVLRQDRGVLRQARQQGAGDRPVRAVRAHLHHRGRRRVEDGSADGSSTGARSAPSSGCSSITLLGYFLGAAVPSLGENIDKAILAILAFSVIPVAWEWWKHRQHGRRHPPSTSRRARRPGRPWSAPSAPRARRRPAGSRRPGCGRSRRPRRRPRAPAARSALVASRTAPPVVITSSTRVTRRPATSGPSASLQVPYVLRLLAHEQRRQADPGAEHGHDRHPAQLQAAEQLGALRHQVGPSARPPAPAAAGSDSKRYLSKYSEATWPDRSVNSPVRRQQASTSAASRGSVMGRRLLTSRVAGEARVGGMRQAARLDGIGSTIFAEMSALAMRTQAINLGQGFPDEDGPSSVVDVGGRGDAGRPQPVPARARHPRDGRGGDRAPAGLLRPRARARAGGGHDRRHRGDRGRHARPGRPRRRGGGARALLRQLRRDDPDGGRRTTAGDAAGAGLPPGPRFDWRRRSASAPS